MSLIKCKKCGEMFSDSYKTCPFCAEDEEYYNGKVKKRGHRQVEKKKKTPSVIGPVLVLVLVLLAAVLVWAFAGDTIKGWFGGKEPDNTPDNQQQIVTPPDNDKDDQPEDKELKLNHLTLIMAPGATEKLTATGGSGETYQWITSDSGVLKVADDGTVTAIAEGSAVVTVTCGEESAACAITVKENADTNTNTNTNTDTNTNTNTNTGTGTTLKDLKIKTQYSDIPLTPRDDGIYDITMQSKETSCQLTLEGITGTPTWKSSNTNVVKVSSDGKLERVGKGEATVTITIGSATAEILVRVN